MDLDLLTKTASQTNRLSDSQVTPVEALRKRLTYIPATYEGDSRRGLIVEMEQNPERPSLNPTEIDRMEELIVNPVILELTRRRGDLDMDGMRYVVIRYGTMYELIFPFKDGHLSIGVELKANPTEVAQSVAKCLDLQV